MQLLKVFCDYYIAIKGRSRRTATEYGKYINNFFEFFGRSYLPELDRIKSVTKRDINAYLVECMRRGNSESCRAGKISALRMFYQYLLEIDLLEVNPVAGIPRPSIPIRISKTLSLVDSIILIQAARDHKIDFYAKRNACMIEVFLNCGFRLSELTHIKLANRNGLPKSSARRKKPDLPLKRQKPRKPLYKIHLPARRRKPKSQMIIISPCVPTYCAGLP